MNFDHTQVVESLYIHWPFCPYKCHFCPFVAIAGHEEYMKEYHQALTKEILGYADLISSKPDIKTVFFGGGTPSTYPKELLLDMFDILNSKFNFSIDNEISIELNPGTVSKEKLELYKSIGINRLSIGVQSLNDEILKKLNRHQSVEQVLWLIENGSKLFDNISIDLIVGMPGIDAHEWKNMVKQIVYWPIKHISMYFLTVHEDTPLYFGVKKQKIILPSDDSVVDLYYWTIDYLFKYGFVQYEISNFSKNSYQSKHNSVYWQRKPYKAFGLGACSFDGTRRFQNEKNLMTYIRNGINGDSVTIFAEELNPSQAWLERLMLGLRQISGLELKDILFELTEKKRDAFLHSLNLLIDNKLIAMKEDNISLTPGGLSVVNEVIVKLSESVQ